MIKCGTIEEKLSELLNILSEEEYTNFVTQDGVMKIYDTAVEYENGYEYLSDKALDEVLALVEEKLSAVKN